MSQFFLSLPDSYDPLVTALENVQGEGSHIGYRQAEEQKCADRTGESMEKQPAAFASNQKNKRGDKFKDECHKCGKVGHLKKDCKQKKFMTKCG